MRFTACRTSSPGTCWCRVSSPAPPRSPATFTLEDYLRREDAVFREARERVDAVVSPAANAAVPNRYVTGSRSHPEKLGVNWNRTQILRPPTCAAAPC